MAEFDPQTPDTADLQPELSREDHRKLFCEFERLTGLQRRVRVHTVPIRYYDAARVVHPIAVAQSDFNRIGGVGVYSFTENAISFHAGENGEVALVHPRARVRFRPAWIGHDAQGEAERFQATAPSAVSVDGNSVTMMNLFPGGVHGRYDVLPGGIKSYLRLPQSILQHIPDGAQRLALGWRYQVDEGGMRLRPRNLTLSDGLTRIFSLADPYMEDQRGATVDGRWFLFPDRRLAVMVCPVSWLKDPARAWPVLIDPTATTGAADGLDSACSGTSGDGGSGGIYWRRCYTRMNLPSLSFDSIDAATAKFQCFMQGGGALSVANWYCDITGAWNSGSSYSVLDALSFNGACGSAQNVFATGWKDFDVLGDLTKGIKKVYNDNPSPTDPVTVKLEHSSLAADSNSNLLYLGDAADTVSAFARFRNKSHSTDYPRIEITYTEAASGTVGPVVGGVGSLIFNSPIFGGVSE